MPLWLEAFGIEAVLPHREQPGNQALAGDVVTAAGAVVEDQGDLSRLDGVAGQGIDGEYDGAAVLV